MPAELAGLRVHGIAIERKDRTRASEREREKLAAERIFSFLLLESAFEQGKKHTAAKRKWQQVSSVAAMEEPVYGGAQSSGQGSAVTAMPAGNGGEKRKLIQAKVTSVFKKRRLIPHSSAAAKSTKGE